MFSNSGKSVFSRYLKYFCSTKNTNISFKMVRMSHHFIVQKSNSQRNSCGFIIWKYCYKSRSMFKSFSQEYTFISVISYTFWSSFSQFYTKWNVSITSKNNSFLIFSWKKKKFLRNFIEKYSWTWRKIQKIIFFIIWKKSHYFSTFLQIEFSP